MLNVIGASLTRLDNDITLLGAGWRVGLAERIVPADRLPNFFMPQDQSNENQINAVQGAGDGGRAGHGNHVTVMTAAAQSFPELHDLDVLRPVTMHNVLRSCQVLVNAAQGFAVHMAGKLEPNREHIADTVAKSLMLVTALGPHIGYDKIVRIGKLVLSDNITLKQAERPGRSAPALSTAGPIPR